MSDIVVELVSGGSVINSVIPSRLVNTDKTDKLKIFGKFSSSLAVIIDCAPLVLGSFPCCLAVALRTPGQPGLGLVGAGANPRPARMEAGWG